MRKIRRLAFALATLAALTGPGQALTPPGPCQFVPELGRFLTGNEDEADFPSAQAVVPETFPNGIAFYELRDVKGRGDGSLWFAIEHCPSSTRLLVEAGPDEAGVRARIRDMVFGDGRYTMRQVAERLAPLGARAELRARSLGACPCGHQNFFFGDWERPGE